MVITDEIFGAYLKCPTKCWLRYVGEIGRGNIYRNWVQYRGAAYRADGINQLRTCNQTTELADAGLVFRNMEAAKWKYAIDLKLLKDDLHSNVHFVERLPPKWLSKPPQIYPGRFIYTNKLSKDDKLLIAYDALVLSEMLTCKVTYGKIVHGDSFTTTKIKASLLINSVRRLLAKVTTLLSNESPPDLILNRHCKICEFQARCTQIAVEKDDLSLLAGMSEKERKRLNNEGIFTIKQLSYTFRARRRPKRLRTLKKKYYLSLKALAIRENKIHVAGNYELKIEGVPVYLDVEGLPDRDFYYLIGMRIEDCDPPKQYSLWANKQEDEKTNWREFLRILDSMRQPVLIHYGSYETNFLKAMCVRYGEPRRLTDAYNAISKAINIQPLVSSNVYFPVLSNSLKDIAKYCGYKWSFTSMSGLISIVWRESWEMFDKMTMKHQLIQYNTEDCEALNLVVKSLLALHLQTSHNQQTNNNVVDVNDLRPDSTFGFKSSYIWPEFEMINKAAYWDYQRDLVHLETLNKIKRVSKVPKGKKEPLIPDQVVKVPHSPNTCAYSDDCDRVN